MKQSKKEERTNRMIKWLLIAAAAVLLAELIHTLFFSFSAGRMLLVFVLLVCVGICLPGFWPSGRKSSAKKG